MLEWCVKDREDAKALFQLPTGLPTPLALSLSAAATTANAPTLSTLSKSFEPGFEPTLELASVPTEGHAGRLLSKEEKERVRQAIEGASTVAEIRRLTRMLASGFVYVSRPVSPGLELTRYWRVGNRPTEKDLQDLKQGQ